MSCRLSSTSTVSRLVAGAALLLGVASLNGCPGHLDDREPYLAALNGTDEAGGAGGAGGVAAGGSSDGAGHAGSATAGASGASGSNGLGGSGGCGDVPTTVLLVSCGPQGCHGGKNPASKLDLASPDVASRVVGIPGFACGGVLADPGSPETSLIYTKITTPVPACGGRMPLAVDPLSDAAIACVLAWIGSLDGGAAGAGGTAGASGAAGAGGT